MDWPGTQKWILLDKASKGAGGGGEWSSDSTSCRADAKGIQLFTYLMDSIREREAEGIRMALGLTGVDILNVSWSQVSLSKRSDQDTWQKEEEKQRKDVKNARHTPEAGETSYAH